MKLIVVVHIGKTKSGYFATLLANDKYHMSLFISEVNVKSCFRLGGRACYQPKHPEAHLPGPLPAWQCHTRR